MHTLPKLPYGYKDLEPFVDEQTMTIHHTKHHQAYIDNLNKALESAPSLKDMDIDLLLKNLDKVPSGIRETVENNAGGHANHSFFWQVMGPAKTKSAPLGKSLEAINKTFGTPEKFKEEFTQKALSVFGSGWAFLIKTADGSLKLKRHSFQNSPLMKGNLPILGIDLWEHAYYLKYQNRKGDYISAWWNVVNWDQVEDNFNKATKLA